MSANCESLNVRLLGPVRASVGGVQIALGSARRTAVLCVLALRAGRAVSREQLVAAVWGEDAPASATANVYTYVSALRRALEPARDRWTAGQLLTSGGGTYQLHVPAESVDVLRFEALRDAAREHRAAGDTAAELAAVEAALALWDGEPMAGVPGPFAAAQRLRLTELRLATAERHAALLAGDGPPGIDRTTSFPARRPPVARQRLFLIGRTSQVRRLRHAAAEARAGRGGSVRIEGGPGSGKTVLVAAALDGLDRVGWAAGDELAQRVPLGVLAESAAAADSGLAARLQALTGDDPDGVVERAATLVREAAAEAPLILVADDLHWADPLTVRVWTALAAEVERHPLLLVATTRQTSGPAAEVIPLPPLDTGAATALIRATAPEPPEPRRLARILDDAGGNPHYLRHLAEDPTGASPAAAVGAHLASLPEATRAALRGVAFLGAYTLSRPGPHPVTGRVSELAVATERDPREVTAALLPARDAGLLSLDGDRAEFRHRVVARTLHESTPGALRIALHRSFADRLAAANGPPELVVAQLLAGDVPLDDSIAAWLSAQVEPLARRAPQITVTMLQRVRAHHALAPARRLPLTAWLARLLLRDQRNAAAEAGWVAARTPDHDLEGEMRWIAARSHEQRGQFQAAAEIARAALRQPRITPLWAEALRTLVVRVDTRLSRFDTRPARSRPALTGGRS